MTDEQYMAYAITLAKRGEGHTSPNPMVGAVVVKDNHIIGEGYHQKAGEAHAEVHALKMAGTDAEGATLYVTLEPCTHFGKTPPCVTRVITSGIKRVVVGMIDPNPIVRGKGIALLEEAGIEVVVGVLEEECLLLNEAFITFMEEHTPFVVLKSAMSLDGKIATHTGDSQWITNPAARQDGHHLRAMYDAMLVGVGTVLADDPQLTCRMNQWIDPPQPDVYILDSQGRTPTTAKLWQAKGRNVYIFVSTECPYERMQAFEDKGATVIVLPRRESGLDLVQALKEIGANQCMSLLVEGGSEVMASFVHQGLFHKVIVYIGDCIIGGAEAKSAVGGTGFARISDVLDVDFHQVEMLDNNIKITAYNRERKCTYVHRSN